MSTRPPERRLLRSAEEIFAAGYRNGLAAKPLSDKQLDALAVILGPLFTAPTTAERGAA